MAGGGFGLDGGQMRVPDRGLMGMPGVVVRVGKNLHLNTKDTLRY